MDEINRLFLFPHYICNNNCITCFLDNTGKNQKYSFEELRALIDDAGDFNFVSIGGGEPLLYKDLAKLLRYINSKKKVDTQIFTNGTLLTKEKCIELTEAGLDSFIITLHSHIEEEHDYITNHKGSYKKLVSAIQIMRESNVRFITAQILLHQYTINNLNSIVNICSKLGISKFSIQNLIPKMKMSDISIDMKQYKSNINSCFDVLRSSSSSWYTNSIPKCISEEIHWGNSISLTSKAELSNISYSKMKSPIKEKDYGLRISDTCIENCIQKHSCCGTWNDYWYMYSNRFITPFTIN